MRWKKREDRRKFQYIVRGVTELRIKQKSGFDYRIDHARSVVLFHAFETNQQNGDRSTSPASHNIHDMFSEIGDCTFWTLRVLHSRSQWPMGS